MPVNHLSEAGVEFIRLFEGAYLSAEVVSSLEKKVIDGTQIPTNFVNFTVFFKTLT